LEKGIQLKKKAPKLAALQRERRKQLRYAASACFNDRGPGGGLNTGHLVLDFRGTIAILES